MATIPGSSGEGANPPQHQDLNIPPGAPEGFVVSGSASFRTYHKVGHLVVQSSDPNKPSLGHYMLRFLLCHEADGKFPKHFVHMQYTVWIDTSSDKGEVDVKSSMQSGVDFSAALQAMEMVAKLVFDDQKKLKTQPVSCMSDNALYRVAESGVYFGVNGTVEASYVGLGDGEKAAKDAFDRRRDYLKTDGLSCAHLSVQQFRAWLRGQAP